MFTFYIYALKGGEVQTDKPLAECEAASYSKAWAVLGKLHPDGFITKTKLHDDADDDA